MAVQDQRAMSWGMYSKQIWGDENTPNTHLDMLMFLSRSKNHLTRATAEISVVTWISTP